MAKKHTKRLGESLVEAGLITSQQLGQALAEQKKGKGRLGEVLIRLGFVPEDTLVQFLAEHLRVPFVDLSTLGDIDREIVRSIPEPVAKRLNLIAVERKDKILTVVMSDPFDVLAIDTVRMRTGCTVEVALGKLSQIREAIQLCYSPETSVESSIREMVNLEIDSLEEEQPTAQRLIVEADGAPVVKYVNTLLARAISEGASDIHIEPQENDISVRFRVDGVLRHVSSPPKKMQSAIITRIKILGKLDIAERRLPQDGRFRVSSSGHEVDIRLSSLPTVYGEKLQMRVLDQSTGLLKLTELGIAPAHLEQFKNMLAMPYGMVLVTGPTGSGKTTTLYSALNTVNCAERNVVTVEDPVEYRLGGINQVQAKPTIGFTFARALRAILRQDPDIIMVGEIRDQETVEIAVKAALTGHLVLSTLHTNDAASAISRLGYMGIEPYLIASSTNIVVAQRLVRRICTECCELAPQPREVLDRVQRVHPVLSGVDFYKGAGCDNCSGTGYRGRVGLYEFLLLTDEIKSMIVSGAKEVILREMARKAGMPTLADYAIEKVREGITTLEEAMSVTFDDETSFDPSGGTAATRKEVAQFQRQNAGSQQCSEFGQVELQGV